MSVKYAKDQPSGFDNHVKNIAIVGATGSIGAYFTKHLLATGKHTITALTRENSKSVMPEGVKVAKINYDHPETLVNALKGQQVLIITMSTAPEGQEASKALVKAASDAGVPWVMPNEYGPDVMAHETMGNEAGIRQKMAEIRELIRQCRGSSFLGLTTGFWYEYSLAQSPHCFGFNLKEKKITFIDEGRTKMNVSTWEQCGRAAAALFSLPQYPQDENDKSLTISR